MQERTLVVAEISHRTRLLRSAARRLSGGRGAEKPRERWGCLTPRSPGPETPWGMKLACLVSLKVKTFTPFCTSHVLETEAGSQVLSRSVKLSNNEGRRASIDPGVPFFRRT